MGMEKMARYDEAITNLIQNIIAENKERILIEIRETKEMYQLLTRWSKGEELTAQEKNAIKVQLLDICKAIPALAVFAAPFGILMLGMLMRVLPFNILPTAFEELEKDIANVKLPKSQKLGLKFWRRKRKKKS